MAKNNSKIKMQNRDAVKFFHFTLPAPYTKRSFVILGSFFILIFIFFISVPDVFASETSGTIDSSYKYAWGENLGWVNLRPDNGGLTITDSAITGYAWSTAGGWLNFNPTASGQAVVNSCTGTLSGYAWSSDYGWINMSGVTIGSDGKFTGMAGVSGTTAGRINFDCVNCDVRTDWRPCAVRTSTTVTTTSTASGGNGAPAGGGAGGYEPKHINAFNVPLTIMPAQSGTLIQNIAAGQVTLEIPQNNIVRKTYFIIREEPLESANSWLVSVNSTLVNSAFYDISAKDQDGNPVTQFPSPITITLSIPKELLATAELGVYWLDENNNKWVVVPGAIIDLAGGRVSFQVNHLTKFAVFGATEKPPEIPVKPPRPGVIKRVTDFLGELIVPEEGGEMAPFSSTPLPEKLLDIGLELDSPSLGVDESLAASVSFAGIGRAPTPVDMTFNILNVERKIVYSERVGVVVEGELIYNHKFSDLSLPPGRYILQLIAVYNDNARTELSREFEVVSSFMPGAFLTRWAWFIVLVILVWIIWFAERRKRSKKEGI